MLLHWRDFDQCLGYLASPYRRLYEAVLRCFEKRPTSSSDHLYREPTITAPRTYTSLDTAPVVVKHIQNASLAFFAARNPASPHLEACVFACCA